MLMFIKECFLKKYIYFYIYFKINAQKIVKNCNFFPREIRPPVIVDLGQKTAAFNPSLFMGQPSHNVKEQRNIKHLKNAFINKHRFLSLPGTIVGNKKVAFEHRNGDF